MATEKNGSWPNMGRWKRSEGMVMVVTEREIEGKCLPSRQQRTLWIDDARRWTVGGLPSAR